MILSSEICRNENIRLNLDFKHKELKQEQGNINKLKGRT